MSEQAVGRIEFGPKNNTAHPVDTLNQAARPQPEPQWELHPIGTVAALRERLALAEAQSHRDATLLADVLAASHMPADYEFGLPSWINQYLYGKLIAWTDTDGRPIRRSEDIEELIRLRRQLAERDERIARLELMLSSAEERMTFYEEERVKLAAERDALAAQVGEWRTAMDEVVAILTNDDSVSLKTIKILLTALAAPPLSTPPRVLNGAAAEKCMWRGGEEGIFSTACGAAIYYDDDPTDFVRFCYHCGRPVLWPPLAALDGGKESDA